MDANIRILFNQQTQLLLPPGKHWLMLPRGRRLLSEYRKEQWDAFLGSLHHETRKRYEARQVSVDYANAMAEYLRQTIWDYFVTFTTRYELTLKSARRLMERFQARTKALSLIPQTLFWVAERFECKDGYHTHGLLRTENDFKTLVDAYQIVSGAEAQNDWASIELRRYDSKKAAAKYCTKYLLKKYADWDLLY
jgi:hypothetical protein